MQHPFDEPSVLDYVLAKLAFWKKSDLRVTDLPEPDESANGVELEEAPTSASWIDTRAWLMGFPWLALAPLGAAMLAQYFIEPPVRYISLAILGYTLTVLLIYAGVWKGQLNLAAPRAETLVEERKPDDLQAVWMAAVATFGLALIYALVKTRTPEDGIFLDILRSVLAVGVGLGSFWLAWLGGKNLAVGEGESSSPAHTRVIAMVALAALSIVLFGGNRFNLLNTLVWGACLAVSASILFRGNVLRRLSGLRPRFDQPIQIKVSIYAMLLLLTIGLVLYFRFNNLNGLPGEMFSDHAEKLYDVNDLMNGQAKIFFERNTGREMFQFYWTALMGLVFGTGISFMSLKLGTVLAGLVTLYYIYRLGDELGGRWVALYALLFAGVAYWPNIISRIGLRFPLYPFCVAPVLYYLFRGLRRQERNDFVWAGIWLGIGLHGYTASRIVPLLVVVAFAIYFLHNRPRGNWREVLTWFMVVAFAALVIVLPLYRYTLDTPEMVAYRSLTRMGTIERPLPGSPVLIFLSNLWNALMMFFWDNGDVWVHSIPHRPALAVIDAALFFVGLALLLVRYVRKPNWRDLLMLAAIPVLLLPSVLSLAFPNENPSLNRTAGVYVPVFLIIALALDAVVRGVREKIGGRSGLRIAVLVAAVAALGSIGANSDLFFVQYYNQYRVSAWNTSEMGAVMRGFSEVVGTPETTWVVGYPYWVDTRLVGINAGYVERNPEINTTQLDKTLADPRAKLFMLNTADTTALDTLRVLYPQGRFWMHKSEIPGKDFVVFMVSANPDMMP